MRQFMAAGRIVTVYQSAAAGRPVIYLHTFAGEGEDVYRELQANSCPDFSLVTIGGLNWNHDMAPWESPPIFAGGEACSGGADAYLKLLLEEIVPQAEKEITGDILWRGIAGYSLAGLFAVYALYHTDLFARAASMSGSLWFPDFQEYVISHEMKRKPEKLYFSLGDRECRTGNPYLRTVQERTEKIADHYRSMGIHTAFQSHSGGHNKHVVKRTAAGIAWILHHCESDDCVL